MVEGEGSGLDYVILLSGVDWALELAHFSSGRTTKITLPLIPVALKNVTLFFKSINLDFFRSVDRILECPVILDQIMSIK